MNFRPPVQKEPIGPLYVWVFFIVFGLAVIWSVLRSSKIETPVDQPKVELR